MQVPATSGSKLICRGASPSILLWAKLRILNRMEEQDLDGSNSAKVLFYGMERNAEKRDFSVISIKKTFVRR